MIMIIAIIYILLSYVIFDQQLKIRKVSENPQPPQKKPTAPLKIQKVSLLHLSFLKELILAMINSIYQSQLVTFPVQATLWYIKGYISSLHINLYVMVKLDNFLHVKKKHFSGLHLPTDICNWPWAILVVYTPATFPLTIKT